MSGVINGDGALWPEARMTEPIVLLYLQESVGGEMYFKARADYPGYRSEWFSSRTLSSAFGYALDDLTKWIREHG